MAAGVVTSRPNLHDPFAIAGSGDCVAVAVVEEGGGYPARCRLVYLSLDKHNKYESLRLKVIIPMRTP